MLFLMVLNYNHPQERRKHLTKCVKVEGGSQIRPLTTMQKGHYLTLKKKSLRVGGVLFHNLQESGGHGPSASTRFLHL